MATRLQTSSTSASRWLESMIVMPWPARRWIEHAHVPHAAGIKPSRRLVEQQQLGVPQQRGGDPQPLAHPV